MQGDLQPDNTPSTRALLRPGLILAVDDDSSFLKLTAYLLEQHNHTVLQARTGSAALDIASRKTPDLVLLDVGLPIFNGFDVCRMLKNDEKLKYVPVVMLTAQHGRETQLRSFECGANDFLVKPIDSDILLTRVQAWLKYRFATAALKEARQGLRAKIKETRDQLQQTSLKLSRVTSEQRSTERELRRVHSYVEQLLAAIPFILIGLDKQGKISHWNKPAARLFGVGPEQVLGHYLEECPIPWDSVSVMDWVQACRETLRPLPAQKVAYIKPGEKAGLVSVTPSPILDHLGAFQGILLFGREETP